MEESDFQELKNPQYVSLYAKEIYDYLKTVEVYQSTVKSLLGKIDIETWSFNREVKPYHVDYIYESLKAMKYPHLLGTIIAVRDIQDQYRIINGQHRLAAINRLIYDDRDDRFLDMPLMLEIYNVNDIDGSESIDLYRKANNNLNVAPDDDPNIILVHVVNMLCKKFPEAIKDSTTGKSPTYCKKKYCSKILKSIIKILSQ